MEQLYTQFNKDDYKKAKKLFKNVSSRKFRHQFKFKDSNGEPTIIRRVINKELMEILVARSKQAGATINDVITAAFMRVAYRHCNLEHNQPFSINVSMDLRRYCKNM